MENNKKANLGAFANFYFNNKNHYPKSIYNSNYF